MRKQEIHNEILRARCTFPKCLCQVDESNFTRKQGDEVGCSLTFILYFPVFFKDKKATLQHWII